MEPDDGLQALLAAGREARAIVNAARQGAPSSRLVARRRNERGATSTTDDRD
jgi:hypothetical protein